MFFRLAEAVLLAFKRMYATGSPFARAASNIISAWLGEQPCLRDPETRIIGHDSCP